MKTQKELEKQVNRFHDWIESNGGAYVVASEWTQKDAWQESGNSVWGLADLAPEEIWDGRDEYGICLDLLWAEDVIDAALTTAKKFDIN